MFNFFKKSQKEIEQQKALQDMANFAMQQQLTATQTMQQQKMFMAGSAGSRMGGGGAGGAGGGGGLGAATAYPGHVKVGMSPKDVVAIGVPCEDCGHRNEVSPEKKVTYCYLCNAPIHKDDVVNSEGRQLFKFRSKHDLF
jgi:hypothetical protein